MELNNINNNRNVNNTSFKSRRNSTQYYANSADSYEFSTPKKKKKKGSVALIFVAALLSAITIHSKTNADIQKIYRNIGEPQISISEFSEDYFYEYNNQQAEESPELKKASDRAERLLNIPIIGGRLYAEKSLEDVGNAIAPEGNEINGYIDGNISQGVISDCWLITPVENLSYTPKGARILHDAINVNKNGDVDVYLKGPDLTYTVTKDEIKRGNEQYSLFSRGDDDMLVFELAVEKFRQDLADGKIERDPNLPDYMYYTNTNGYNTMRMGETRQAYWLLAGITNGVEAKTEEDIQSVINSYISNPEDSLLDVELSKDAKVKDVNGKKVMFYASHGYGVKKISENTITLICATSNNREIVISFDQLAKLPISSLVYCSL
ncbi:hypothetical protein II906_03735 [bacterium]|nr:hypothetical protein [bacterium]